MTAGIVLAALSLSILTGDVAAAAPLADSLAVADSLRSVAVAAAGRGEVARSLPMLERAVAIRRRWLAPGDTLVATTLQDVGQVRYALNDWRGAAAAWREALEVLARGPAPPPRRLAWCESDLAETERLLGHYDQAESLLTRAAARCREDLPASAFCAVILNNLGALLWDQGRFDETERLYRESLRMAEADPAVDPSVIATDWLNLGVVSRDQGRYAEAESLLTHALARARVAVPGEARLAYFLNELGKLYAVTGRQDAAIPIWEEARRVLAGLPVPRPEYEAQLAYDIGRARLARGDAGQAGSRFAEALKLREQTLGAAHPEVGVTLIALAQAAGPRSQRARELTDRAIRILEAGPAAPEAKVDAYALRARLRMAGGQPKEARADLAHALDLVEELRPQRGGTDESRISFLQRYLPEYQRMVGWLVEAGRVEEALRWAERTRGRVLREQLAGAREDLRRGIPPQALARLDRGDRDARARLGRLQRETDELRSSLTLGDSSGARQLTARERDLADAVREQQAVEAELKLLSPVWQRLLRREAVRVSAREVRQRLLAPGGSLLLYQVGAEGSFLFVMPPGSGAVECQPLVISKEAAAAFGVAAGPVTDAALTSLVTGAPAGANGAPDAGAADGDPGLAAVLRGVTGVASLAASSRGGPAPEAAGTETRSYWLWRTLVPPAIWSRIRDATETLIIPDASLDVLPFEALVTQEPAAGREPLRWLDDGPAVRYGPSLTAVLEAGAAPSRAAKSGQAPEVVSLSDPRFGPGGLPRLPGTARESAAVAAAFPPGRVRVLQGEGATEAALRRFAPQARFLHLATHGLVDPARSEQLAALALAPPGAGGAPAPEDDGLLHLFEVESLGLDCELAVLSACETSLGRRLQGEGVFALSRGFLAARARRVVATLWPVADEAAAVLVGEFFARIAAAEKAGRPIAYASLLRDAKRSVKARPGWEHPFYWAPFVLSGAR